MIEKKITLTNEIGLHARPAARFAKLANKFSSDINILYKEKNCNAKSIMLIMALGIRSGENFILQANGKDEKEAISALEELSYNGLE